MTPNLIIKSIAEAYSTQPNEIGCSTNEEYERSKINKAWAKIAVKEIKLEPFNVGFPFNNESFMVYACYGFQGQKLAHYKADTVNVKYQ